MNREVFPAVEPASPVHAALGRLRDEVAGDPGLVPDGDARVRAELLTRRRPDGGVEVRRFLWSVQRPDPSAPGGLAARTLVHVPDGSATRDFPDDPVLDRLAGPDGRLAVHPDAARVDVLRYIPLRRVTVRLHDVPGLPGRVIAKTQEAGDLRSAHAVLRAVDRAVATSPGLPFRVPRPLALDDARRLLLLTELPGRPLSRSLDPAGGDDHDAMTRLGVVHAALHGLDVAGLPAHDIRDAVRAAGRAATQLATLLPSQGPRVGRLVERLAASAPTDAAPVFCQGDFVPSQVLCDPGGWAVLDLDDAHRADPYAEVAALWVALPRELSVKDPVRAERLRDAYLRSYRAHAADPTGTRAAPGGAGSGAGSGAGRGWDEERWRWHLAVAALRHAARRVVKGRAVPGETEAAVDALDARAPGRRDVAPAAS